MDLERLIIYAVLGAAYYAYKQFSKNFGTSKTQKKPMDKPAETQDPLPKKKAQTAPLPKTDTPSSIFDLLEELKKQEKQQEKLVPVSKPELEPINYEAQPEKVKVESVNPYLYTSSKKIALTELPETSSLFEEYLPKRTPHPLLKTLKEKGKLKEAFILNEILRRRF